MKKIKRRRVEFKTVVQNWMKPRLEGLVRHPLYSTWAMVYHMETAARMLLAPSLDRNEEAVGAGVTVKHIGPAGHGDPIKVVCRLANVRGRKIYTRLEVYTKNRKIGEGSHIQVVMPRDRFIRLLSGADECS